MHNGDMHRVLAIAAMLAVPASAFASGSLFSQLVDASAKNDQRALSRLLSTRTLSSSTGTVGEGNRVNGGSMRHGVPVTELAAKLKGCAVKQWRDTGSEQGSGYILWECPRKRAPENDCYFYSYRAELLDPRYHPANLYIGEMPSWDAKCGRRIVAPPGALPPPPARQ